MIEIADQCRNRWQSILPLFGVDSRHLDGKHHPCPLCGGKDRFRFTDKDQNGWTICNQCGRRDGVKLVMDLTRMSFAEAAQAIRERLGETTEAVAAAVDLADARQRASALWAGGTPIFNDDAGRYLQSRGIVAPYPRTLRFHPTARATDHPSKRVLPALLALVMDPDGQPVNVHRTFLEHGRKADIPAPRKMMSGTVPPGSAIRLGAYEDGRLGIAEGIETALKVRQRFGIACWAAIDAEKLTKFAIPADVREIQVFGDNDLNFVGQWAAFALARRAATMKDGPAKVTVHIPDRPGTDWADDLPVEEAA